MSSSDCVPAVVPASEDVIKGDAEEQMIDTLCDETARPTEAHDGPTSSASEEDDDLSGGDEGDSDEPSAEGDKQQTTQSRKDTQEEPQRKTDEKSPETDTTGKPRASKKTASCGRIRKPVAEMDTLLDKIISLIDTSESPSDDTLVKIRETVARCRAALGDLSSRRKRRSPGVVRKASQRKPVKKEGEQAPAEAPAEASKPGTIGPSPPTQQQRNLFRNINNNNNMPVLRMRGPPMFFGGEFWQPPPHMGAMPDVASPAALYFDAGGRSPFFGPPQHMMVDWRFAQRQGSQLSRRARDRRDRLVQEKEQAFIRGELRAARSAKDFEKAIEKARRHGMDYEVQSAMLRLEKLTE